MSELRVRLDPLNPGQFFACCGLLELFSLEWPDVMAWFVVDSFRPRVAEFVVQVQQGVTDLRKALTRLKQVQPIYPDLRIEAAIRPAVLPYDGRTLVLDWWLNEFRDDTVSLKCWAGRVQTKKLFSELLPLLDDQASGDDLFERIATSKTKFGFDPRSSWTAHDVGFSPDEHEGALIFPAVEILAAVGLQGFRPQDRRKRVRYCLWQTPLQASVARVAFRAPWDGLPNRSYEFDIRPRGQSYKYFAFAAESKKESAEE